MYNADSYKKIVIIPVYNDSLNVVKVLAKFTDRIVDEISLIIDGCTNNDLDKIEKAASEIATSVQIIRNGGRKGVGYAIREGIDYALAKGYNVIVVMAGNNKDDPREIPRLLKPILEDGCDYVQGSRFLPGGRHVKNPVLRGIFSRLYPLLWTLATDIRCTDVTNGFRAYRTEIFKDKRIDLWQSWLDGYGLEYYLHFKVLKLRYKTREVPVSKIYPFRHKGGYSVISPLRDWWQIVGPFVYLALGIRN